MYRLMDHTADLAIEADGEDLGAALAEAARAVTEVVTGRPPPQQADLEVVFTLEAPDEQALVVAFLSELLWILESQGILWCVGGATVEAGGPGWRVRAAGNGVLYDPHLHGHGVEVKAVTYHDLQVRRAATVQLRVVLDL